VNVCKNFDLAEAAEPHVNAENLKGLINIVPRRGAGDRPNRYCIAAFAMNMYCKLLTLRQQYKKWFRTCVFSERHDKVLAFLRIDSYCLSVCMSFTPLL